MSRMRSALSRLAWGYLLLFFHINIEPISLLPQWVAWLVIAWGIYGLADEDRDLALLWPFSAALALLDLSQPLLAGAWAGWLTLLQTVLYLYVHFGLLTSCARLAGRFQAPGRALDVRLRRLRNAFITLDTLTGFVLSFWLAPAVSVVLGAVLLVIAVIIAVSLFQLRRCFPAALSEETPL